MNMTIENGKLIITVDVSDAALKAAVPSSTGKSRVVATTSGFTSVNGRVKVGLNVITAR